MIEAIATFALCAAVIVPAGVFLTKYADAIAEVTGLGRLLVGSVLLAGATSLPELGVDISAVRLGQPDLAVGNLMGACLCNMLTLAILDLLHRQRGRLFSRLAAAHALSGAMVIVLASIVGVAVQSKFGGSVDGRGILGIGSLALILTYLGGLRMVYLDQRLAASDESPGSDQAVLLPPGPSMSLGRALGGFAAAAAVILIAAPYLASSADRIAAISGLGRSFVGTTLVAFCTTLPELVASIAALRMGAYDLAIGNVFGSNAFNMFLLAVLDFVQPGAILSVVSPIHGLTAAAVAGITAVAVMGQLYRVERRRSLVEPDALLVIVLVLAAMAMVYYLG